MGGVIFWSYLTHKLVFYLCEYGSQRYLVMYIQNLFYIFLYINKIWSFNFQTQDLLEDNFSLIIEDIPCLAKVVLLYSGTKWNVTWWFFYKVYYKFSDSLYHPYTFKQRILMTKAPCHFYTFDIYTIKIQTFEFVRAH